MACVVLPSETARLVYGYLVKEKLDNIALQFLENSPYLTDCYHIVKSGYHFNTKLLSKELHELIQEYSVIHNLVNKKIGLLPKTSSLYKRIKLHCESLSEIVDLILFRKFSISRSDENSPVLNKSKEREDSINDIKDAEKNINDSINNIALQLEESLSNELVCSSRTEEKDKDKEENETEVLEEMQGNFHIKFSTKNNSPALEKGNVECDGESITSDIIEVSGNDETSKKSSTIEDHNPVCEVLKENNDIALSLTDIDHNAIEKLNKIEISSIPDESNINIDGKIKVVRIDKDNQQDQDKNQLPSALTQTLSEMDSGMNIENGSVLFVSPDVGNITINQDGNQIIVIPIDYYKPQASSLGETENNNQDIQNEELVSCGEKSIEANSRTIFEDIATITSPVPTSLSSSEVGFNEVKKSLVDDNIITEATFLQNKDMIYDLENKVKSQLFEDIASTPSVAPPVAAPMAAPMAAPVVTAPVQTLILSQVIEQNESRFRRILPKNIEINPVVVVQPLIENNKVVMCKNKTNLQSTKVIPKRATKKKSTKNYDKEATTKNMLNVKIPTNDEICPSKDNETEEKQISDNSIKSDTINEEKENLSANEKKPETPIVIVRKNSKRLSLSTPRRRSHIRALEFTTPPKTKGEIKKSKTSPKLKVDEIKVTNKNVRNTLFKSPNSEIVSKTPICLESEKRNCQNLSSIAEDVSQTPTLSVSASRTFTKTCDSFTSWDSDLRDFITSGSNNDDVRNSDSNENKRTRKPKRSQKNDKKPAKKAPESTKKQKALQISPSPSKINLTAKRNTYSISGTEEGSPVRSLLEELDLVTPFKDSDPIRSAEETPLTKLFRENINGIDIDLSMITTPVFPPTPSIIVTPDIEDSSVLSGTCYYTPLKDNWKEKGAKNELHKSPVKDEDSEQLKKKDTKETQEKVIGELVSKAKEIIGLGSDGGEENIIKKPLSGKVLSMVKIQMITQCDKKLCENIPINDDSNFESENSFVENLNQESAKFDLKDELEEKKKRALRKIKSVKENLTLQTKKKVKRSSTKRKKNIEDFRSAKKLRKSSVNESNSISDEKTLESSESMEKNEVLHSTPYQNKKQISDSAEENSRERKERTLLDEIREDFPAFEDNNEFLELPMKTRKKLHYIKHFLASKEVVTFLKNFDESKLLKLKLKRSRRKFFQVFYKWLRHPHAHEINKSEETKALFKEYLVLFEKIKKGVSHKGGEQTEMDSNIFSSEVSPQMSSKSRSQLSDDESDLKLKTGNKKEDEIDEGPVSVLPLKKRKANVQPLGLSEIESTKPSSDKRKSSENPSRTQNFLQDIDVDRFLSQIHGQGTR